MDHKNTIEQLHQSQKMGLVGEFTVSIAHDFNNLLTAIHGYCRIIYDKIPEQSSVKSNIREIENIATKATQLSQRLLTFSKQKEIDPILINLNETISNFTNILKRIIGKNIKIITNLNPETCYVSFDPIQFEHVLLNLSVNARDAMPEGGILTIETKIINDQFDDIEIDDCDECPKSRVVISISDTGTGISRKITTQMFNPFFTTKDKDTGLGLTTVYRLIKQYGGDIGVFSRISEGTTFHLYLPKLKAS